MNIERILTFLIMFIAIFSLFILSIITIYAFFLKNYNEHSIYKTSHQTIQHSNRLSTYFHIILSTNITIDDRWLLKINSTFMEFKEKALFGALYYFEISNNGNEYIRPMEIVKIEQDYNYLYELLTKNKKDLEFYKNQFIYGIENYVQNYLEIALKKSDKNDEIETIFMYSTAIIGTIICGLTLLIIIPTSCIALIGNNNKIMKKLQKVNAKEVLNFISDSYLNISFKEYCKNHQQLKYFLFLEKSLLYSEYCEEIFNLNSIDNYITNSNTNLSEIQIDKFESKKCEVVFEIITEFLNSKGEYFLGEKQIGGKKLIEKVNKEFKSNPMNLPENLFNIIESNISIHLFPTLKLFKSNRKTIPNLTN